MVVFWWFDGIYYWLLAFIGGILGDMEWENISP